MSLKNSKLKTAHNAFRDSRVHFFRQPFSKWLYIYIQLIVSQKVHRTWASHCSQKRIEGKTKPGE